MLSPKPSVLCSFLKPGSVIIFVVAIFLIVSQNRPGIAATHLQGALPSATKNATVTRQPSPPNDYKDADAVLENVFQVLNCTHVPADHFQTHGYNVEAWAEGIGSCTGVSVHAYNTDADTQEGYNKYNHCSNQHPETVYLLDHAVLLLLPSGGRTLEGSEVNYDANEMNQKIATLNPRLIWHVIPC